MVLIFCFRNDIKLINTHIQCSNPEVKDAKQICEINYFCQVKSLRFKVHVQSNMLKSTPVMDTHSTCSMGRVSRPVVIML